MSSEAEIGQFLRSITLPTAFFCAGDSYAIDTIRSAKTMGLRIPEDLSIIGLDDLLVSRYLDPPLTSLSFDKEGMGSKATELLYQIIQEQPFETINLFPTFVVPRGSVKQMPVTADNG